MSAIGKCRTSKLPDKEKSFVAFRSLQQIDAGNNRDVKYGSKQHSIELPDRQKVGFENRPKMSAGNPLSLLNDRLHSPVDWDSIPETLLFLKDPDGKQEDRKEEPNQKRICQKKKKASKLL